MRVLVWGINYSPEATGIAPYNVMLCEFLQSRGHSVEMVTSFPYYPMWKKSVSDRGRFYRRDVISGVTVHRCWHYVPQQITVLRRALHELSFVAASLIRVLTLRRPDVVVAVSPPLLLGPAAWLVRLLCGIPFVFHVQDLQPDAAFSLGMLNSGLLFRVLSQVERFSYRNAARVSGISPGMLSAFTRKGVPVEKQVSFPNGVAIADSAPQGPRGRFRARLGFAADDFLAIYSGNLGMKQGLLILVEAAARLSEKRVRIVICGDGAAKEPLASAISARGLANVVLLPLQDRASYEEMLTDADICLITQRSGSGQCFFPSKLLSALGFEKAILAVSDGDSELAVALKEAGFGFQVSPDDPETLARALEEASRDPVRLREMGRRGRAYVERFDTQRVLPEFERVLEEVVAAE